ncbi:MAG: dipicolinate synthase subunit B [Eubacteriales bacterium]
MKIGYAICGSFCTHAKALKALIELKEKGYEILPILSENTQRIDTRFGKASDYIVSVEGITGNRIIKSIEEAEPLGPSAQLDALIIAPCTGNTLAKMAHGITDNCVTMAAKAHLRNRRPLIIGLCTNDALSGNAANIGTMLGKKYVYFTPMLQDDIDNKPASLVCDMSLVVPSLEEALRGHQLQPIFVEKD